MKVHVPFHYSVEFIPRGRADKMHAPFASAGDIDLREVARADVRPVMKVRHNGQRGEWNGYSTAPFATKADGGKREIVAFEDSMWVEFGPAKAVAAKLAEQETEDTPFSVISLKKEPPTGEQLKIYDKRSQVANLAYKSIRRGLRANDDNVLRHYSDDGGDAKRARLSRYAGACIVVDGVLYIRCREPSVSVKLHDNGVIDVSLAEGRAVRGDLQHRFGTDSGYGGGEITDRWSLPELDLAIEEAKKRHGNRRVVGAVNFELIDPAPCINTPHVWTVLRLAGRAMGNLLEDAAALTPGTLEKAVILRDALIGCGGQVTKPLRRALETIALLEPITEEESARWAAMAPRRSVRYDRHKPLSRAATVVEHADRVASAAEAARQALERLAAHDPRSSWEDRAIEPNGFSGPAAVSRELLSREAVWSAAVAVGAPAGDLLAMAEDGILIFSVDAPPGFQDKDPRTEAMVCVRLNGKSAEVVKSFVGPAAEPGAEEQAVNLVEGHLEAAGFDCAPALQQAPIPAYGG